MCNCVCISLSDSQNISTLATKYQLLYHFTILSIYLLSIYYVYIVHYTYNRPLVDIYVCVIVCVLP